MHSIILGTLLANLDMVDKFDQRECMYAFFDRHPDIRDWCQRNISNWDQDKVKFNPIVLDRYHVEYSVEISGLPESEAMAARLRFA